MPTKSRLKWLIEQEKSERLRVEDCLIETAHRIADLQEELLKANESWAREKKRADENHRMLQGARDAAESLNEALYPMLFSPAELELASDLLEKAKEQYPEAFGHPPTINQQRREVGLVEVPVTTGRHACPD
jgi:hypothetical protein